MIVPNEVAFPVLWKERLRSEHRMLGIPMCLALSWGGSTPQPEAELKLQISRKWVELGASLSWLPRQGEVNDGRVLVSSLDWDLSWVTL